MYRPCEPIILLYKGGCIKGFCITWICFLANKIASNNWGQNGAGNK